MHGRVQDKLDGIEILESMLPGRDIASITRRLKQLGLKFTKRQARHQIKVLKDIDENEQQ